MVSTLFPLVRDHYYLKHPKIIEEIDFKGHTYLSKYERVDDYLTDELITKHQDHKIIIATSIPVDAPYIIFDYNGDNRELFYHKMRKILRQQGLDDFTAFESKTPSHLHLYIYCGAISAPQREELGKIISNKLEDKLQKQWRIFPNLGLPKAYNILNLHYDIFKG